MEINMPTTLSIIDADRVNIVKRIFRRILPNPPKVEKVYVEGITLKKITYKKRNDKIAWKKIANIVKEDSKYVLCSENVRVPITYGIQRFASNKLSRRLCENAAISVIENINVKPSDIAISLYDPRAAYSDLLDILLQYSAQIRVVSNNINFYEEESARLMEEYGVTVLITDNILSLDNSDIMIAPDKIRINLGLSKNTFVFTAEEPGVDLGCNIISKYRINTPIKYKSLIPDYIEDEYLLSYLYSELKIYELGSLVPVYCVLGRSIKTVDKIAEELENMVENAWLAWQENANFI